MLELRSATFRYPVRRPRRFRPWATGPGPGIRGIDLTLTNGTILGLVGPNGAGKSTLLQVMANLLPLEDGTLSVEGNLTVNSIKTPANIGGVASTAENASASIDSVGFASFKSASIGGWVVDPTTFATSDSKVLIDSTIPFPIFPKDLIACFNGPKNISMKPP